MIYENKIKYLESMFLRYSLLNMKVIWVYYLLLINPYRFMSGCLRFPKNIEDMKDRLRVYIISCKIFLQYQKLHELIATLTVVLCL